MLEDGVAKKPLWNNIGRLTVFLIAATLTSAMVVIGLLGSSVLAKTDDAAWHELQHLLPERSAEIAAADVALADEFLPTILPCSMEEGWVSSEFGVRVKHPVSGRKNAMHKGIDLAVYTGTPIVATAEGQVIFTGRNGGYGKLVKIRHFNGIETRYAHLSHIYVKKGEYVTAGEKIALSGNTGASTGPHLHYEIRVNDKPVNPRYYMPELP